jgi:S1-C subfamily serine protease
MLARSRPRSSAFSGRLAQPARRRNAARSPMDRYFRPDEEKERTPSIEGVGSGVIVSADGLIITNHHVVTLSSGNTADAITIESDRRRFHPK